MRFTILDCYTDEPAGLGVPPYIGTYPRYIAGAVIQSKNDVSYITIDDIRFYSKYKKDFNSDEKVDKIIKKERGKIKTNIKIKNLSKNILKIKDILEKTDVLIVIAGVHTPGKYLAAIPGTTKEIVDLLENIKYKGFRLLTGPAAYGSGLYGGKVSKTVDRDLKEFNLVVKDLEYKFKKILSNNFTEDVDVKCQYEDIKNIAVFGARIVREHPDYPKFVIAEIETSKGCDRKKGCSFCTEPLKFCGTEIRDTPDIVKEVEELHNFGVNNFRLGKQSCFFSYGTAKEISFLLRHVKKYAEVLHIDNINPATVTPEKVEAVVKHCTSGNIAAFGVESFDEQVVKANNLNSDPKTTYEAVKMLNRFGAVKGKNGMPKFLPGINILFGLMKENKNTHKENMFWLKKMLDENLLLRRINIRQVVAFPGTRLYDECGNKYIKKNKKNYWSWRDEIRQKIDYPMLQKLLPVGTILKKVRTEIYDGKITFGRQIGTYPLIVGIKGRHELDEFVDVKITGHMLRSVTGEIV
ncbi:MAG: radical SAM protein [Nanoarchaeota archaeon]|nr:radical SAM protein [Nanoarchaeota archaeon]